MENLENEILDREEAALKRLNELLNVRTAEVFIMGDILKNSDASALTRVSTPIANLSETLPMPGWYYSQTAEYTWLLDDGDVHRLPSELENLSENPSVLHMKCTDVQREDLSAYAESLKGFGYSAILEESGGTVKYYLLRDDWQMSMVWNDKTVKINLFGHLPCFVPTWYRPQ